MRKSKILIFTFLVSIILFIPIVSFADTLEINISVNKEEIIIGDTIIVKVAWDSGVQAADFSLNYNPKKLEYVKSDIDDVYINNDIEKGELKTAWISLDDTDRDYIEYTFKVKKGGNLKLSTKINGGFAKGNLEVFEDYNNNELTIKVPRNYTVIIIMSIAIIFIIIFFVKKGGKRWKQAL